MIRIAIADDNSFLVKSTVEKLQFFEDFTVKFTAKDGAEIVKKVTENANIDVILMDIEMPGTDGIEAAHAIKQRFPQVKIIMLTVFDNDENIFNAIKAGADGYLLKEIDPEELHKKILETYNGGAAMHPSIAFKTLKLLRNPTLAENFENREEIILSARETEVLEQISKGLNYINIAENLFLSPSTVRKHIENIYGKLRVHSKLEAVEKARRNNLI